MKVIISNTTNNAQLYPDDAVVIHDITNLKDDETIEWILIDWDDIKSQERYLHTIRSKAATSLLPIFCNKDNETALGKTLSDGHALHFDALQTKAEKINSLINEVKDQDDNSDPEIRLLMFLLSRPQVRLTFSLDISLPQLVRYPLMEVFISEPQSALKRINALSARGILAPDRIEDEVQMCPHCKNSLINYKNICPECHTVDIKKQRFLHCFSCGNTAPETEFLKKDAIICTHCNTKLRHIGIDYDRPLEEYICNAHQHAFMEPEVYSHCLSCHKECTPEHLISHKLCAYHLSDKGVNFIVNKENVNLEDLKDEHSYFDQSFFILFLDWMIRACTRNEHMKFTLFNINIKNNVELLEHYGLIKTRQLCDDFFNFLRSYFRSTDTFTRRHNEVATVIFTQTSSKDVSSIKKNVDRFLNDTQEGCVKVVVEMNTICSDTIDLTKYDAALLLAELDAQASDD